VLVDANYSAVLADFGLTTVVSGTSGMAATSTFRGSLRWLAPELFDVEDTNSAGLASRPSMASDVYSLSILWWEVRFNDCYHLFVVSLILVLPSSLDHHRTLSISYRSE
jgi:serine/threonine protein kinase